MTIQRMDNIGIVVDDLEAATAFFVELGLELEGEASVEDVGWTAASGSTAFEPPSP
jgi:catechol 2,3-dioxygenase-like lactoylglutathione lyase family enzyme